MTDVHGPGKLPAARRQPSSTTVIGSAWAPAGPPQPGSARSAQRVAEGLRCVGVPTSRASHALGRELGIPMARMRGPVDIAFDGADLVTPAGLTIKGAGGALVRERIVDGSAGRFLVLVDAPKVATSLGSWGVLPVAVVPFAAEHVALALADLSPSRRPGRSDDGLAIIDLDGPGRFGLGAPRHPHPPRGGRRRHRPVPCRAGRCAGRRAGRIGPYPYRIPARTVSPA